jgi:hypothetical protein
MNRYTLPLRVWLRSKRLVSRNFRRVRSVVTAAISVPAASAADDLVDEENRERLRSFLSSLAEWTQRFEERMEAPRRQTFERGT